MRRKGKKKEQEKKNGGVKTANNDQGTRASERKSELEEGRGGEPDTLSIRLAYRLIVSLYNEAARLYTTFSMRVSGGQGVGG